MFASDNAAPVHPLLMEAMAAVNHGPAPSYGADETTARAEALMRQTFETDCTVLFVATGMAANGLGLAALTPPWGAVLCHRHAHIAVDEGGAPEFYTGAARLALLPAEGGKLAPETVEAEAQRWTQARASGARPFVLSLTQATESGRSYAASEIAALAAAAHAAGLKLHMDGARFANAVAFTGASPADLTWRSGVDVLSFGATKNGAMAGEAVVCFNRAAAEALAPLRKRAGHLLSKHRYIAAQFAAYLEGDLWLLLAGHANAMARRLAALLASAGGVIVHPVEANEVFVRLAPETSRRLSAAGAVHHPWPEDGPDAHRFVASWATSGDDIATVEQALGLRIHRF
jgi:threonine aldolase